MSTFLWKFLLPVENFRVSVVYKQKTFWSAFFLFWVHQKFNIFFRKMKIERFSRQHWKRWLVQERPLHLNIKQTWSVVPLGSRGHTRWRQSCYLKWFQHHFKDSAATKCWKLCGTYERHRFALSWDLDLLLKLNISCSFPFVHCELQGCALISPHVGATESHGYPGCMDIMRRLHSHSTSWLPKWLTRLLLLLLITSLCSRGFPGWAIITILIY